MKKLAAIVMSLFIGWGLPCNAQETIEETPKVDKIKIFDHLNVGVSVGTIGFNLDAEMPINKSISVRAGFSMMPKFNVPLHFNMMTYANGEVSEGNFQNAKELLQDLAGFEVNQHVRMNCKPNMYTFNVLCDVYPFHKKNWRFTTGFYIGPRKVGTSINAMREMPTLVSVGIYNGMHDYVLETDFIETPIHGDYYLDPDVADKLKAKFTEYGRMGIHVGDFVKDGKPYMMEPGSDGTVKAEAIVNTFRPYLGFGYSGDIDKAKKMKLSFDCGAMFWGGHPKIVTHEGVDLTRDVRDIAGKAGRYVRLIKKMKVYPMLNVRISYNIF